MIIKGKKAIKINSESDDKHRDNDTCIIIGESIDIPDSDIKMYIVIWKDMKEPVIISSKRLTLLKEVKDIELKPTKILDNIKILVDKKFFKLYETKEKNKNL